MQSIRDRFATTQWTLVLAAGKRGSPEAEEALARLCSLYWYAIFAFVRRHGHSLEGAQDLTQSFFARLIEEEDFAAADRDRGRFRTFLLTACQHFLLNEHDRRHAIKRGGHSDAHTASRLFARPSWRDAIRGPLTERQRARSL